MNEEVKAGKEFEVRVKPNSSASVIYWDEEAGCFMARVVAPARENKANEELVKLFRKRLKLKVEVVKGEMSRDKKVRVL